MLRMLDLFSGIGGFSYAGEKLVGGYETVAFCEYDKHAQKVLRKHWPDTEIIDDVRELANDAFPALLWKLDRQPINVRIPIEALVVLGRDDAATHDAYDWRYTATLTWDDWIMVCRELL